MEKITESQSEQKISSKWIMEIVVALIIIALGGLVIFDSVRLGGAAWKDDGPGSGYFPFYVGSLIVLASIVTIVQTLRKKPAELGSFISREQARSVFSVLLPTILYVGTIQFIGIYVASAIFIAGFMCWFGKYSWLKILIVAVSISILFPFFLYLIVLLKSIVDIREIRVILCIAVTLLACIAGATYWPSKHGYDWLKAIPISIGVNILFFLTFEEWFLIPLKKGALEKLFGY